MCREQSKKANNNLHDISTDKYNDLQRITIDIDGENELFFRPSMFDKGIRQNRVKSRCSLKDNNLHDKTEKS